MNISKIIKAYIGAGTYSTTEPITQGDYGYILQIEGAELPPIYRVDFSNDRHNGEALSVYGNEDGAEVPEELIATGKDIFAFYYYIEEGFGKTVYTWKIPNDTRANVGDREPTPTQQDSIDQLIVRSNEAVTSAEQSASAAGQSAQNAVNSAIEANRAELSAKSHALNAEQSSINACSSANDAMSSATASAQSANQSAQIKADVEDLVDNAQGYANASAQSASASANSASQAQGFAQSASASANSASGYASQADISANTASNKASEASTSAQTATQKATESAQSASQALTYKTDAESAKTASQTAQGLAESARDSAISAKNDAEQIKTDVQNIADGIDTRLVDVENDVIKAFPTDTASGSIASFSDGADDIPLKSLVVDINPIQDLHGYDSPWPAGAINIWDEEWELSGTRINSKNLIPVLPNTSYAWVSPAQPANGLRFYDASKTLLSTVYSVSNGVFTTPADCYYIWFALGSAYGTTYNHDVSINYPSTITTYHPYENICPISGWTEVSVNHSDADITNPTTLTIQLGQTVYGGKLDVLSGVLTIDRAKLHKRIGDMNNIDVAPGWKSAGVKDIIGADFNSQIVGAICSAFPSQFIRANTRTVNDILYLPASGIGKTQTELISSYPDLELDFVIPYATPLAIQLTPNQINSLYGVNNIWSDSGDTTAEYRADTKAWVQRKIAEAIASLT